jgi:D-alanine--D-alanine ligase
LRFLLKSYLIHFIKILNFNMRQHTESRLFKLGIIFGGPSAERGISLNSARSIMDHLTQVEICPFYVDLNLRFHEISRTQLYSNTPCDFDFKLADTARPLSDTEVAERLRAMDLIFPAIHGSFGETGELQAMLEALKVPFVGSSSESCRRMFYKHDACDELQKMGIASIPTLSIRCCESGEAVAKLQRFFVTHALKRAIVKPSAGGSSIGVSSVETAVQAWEKVQELWQSRIDECVIVEPFCEGREFTVLVIENEAGKPTALLPTEIELSYESGGFFDYRRKYLPTSNTKYHTPARFSDETIASIRSLAEDIFVHFGVSDFARFDGWLFADGRICFSDFNPITGMEQNSFLFRQASLLGLSHRGILNHVVASACRRYKIQAAGFRANEQVDNSNKIPVYIIMGGPTAERQVSLMSGTNIWLKLRSSNRYDPSVFLMGQDEQIWPLEYSYALNHTAEEVLDNCVRSAETLRRLSHLRASISGFSADLLEPTVRKPLSIEEFLEKAKQASAFVFNALHGGDGENGVWQQRFEKAQLPYNGPGSEACKICMDKWLTGETVRAAAIPGVNTLPRISLPWSMLVEENVESLWQKCCEDMQLNKKPDNAALAFLIKPRYDGCSAGIAVLRSPHDLEQYRHYLKSEADYIPAGTFADQLDPVEMPTPVNTDYLIEPYLETDRVWVDGLVLKHEPVDGWLELTVGVMEGESGLQALSPSITLASGGVLSLEEKFQGGTGVNLTPAPAEIISLEQTQLIRERVALTAQSLKIRNYSRLDIFFNCFTSEIILIEANTLPGMTASTVIYHQALAETPPMRPLEFIERIIDTALNSAKFWNLKK